MFNFLEIEVTANVKEEYEEEPTTNEIVY